MRAFISTKVHGMLDYMSGVLILASPWLFGFAHLGGAPLFIPVVFGSLQLLMVVFTNHELGIIKVIPIQLHLVVDMLMGFFMMVSPFLYDFHPFVVWPHLLLGALLFGAGLFTYPSPFLDGLIVFDERGF
jgi:hypothetical protein